MRKLYYFFAVVLPIFWLTYGMDHGDVKPIILISSIVMVIGGIIAISTYTGPERTGMARVIIGKPLQIVRVFMLLYSVVACIMLFNVFELGHFFR
jgi:hypothetical protein